MEEKTKSKTYSNYSDTKGWYHDKYVMSIIQRNFLFIFCILSICVIIGCLVIIKTMIEKNTIEPYIINVEHPGAMPSVISVQNVREFSDANQVLIEYFLTRYIKMRESYNKSSFKYDYGTIVRLFSSEQLYAYFKNQVVNNPTVSPVTTLGEYGSIEVKINQIVPKVQDSTYIFRISKQLYRGQQLYTTNNYQITLKYGFEPDGMEYEDAMINPLGLKVYFYEMLDEKNLTAN